ncbi:MAG TPA: aminoglycoside phosphotransferase family protein [Hanamia sp.]
MLGFIAKLYGLPENECSLKPFGNGLINRTWILECRGEKFILQKINDTIFPSPCLIAENIHHLNVFFKTYYPDYLFENPVATLQNEEMVIIEGEGYFRMFHFVKGSVTFDTVDNSSIAFEGARQFGKFTKLLSTFDSKQLHITLTDFHNLDLRYNQFELALKQGNKSRIEECKSSIDFIKEQKYIVDIFNRIQTNVNFKKRVTHHDTKISNVLFDKNGRGLCVIDLDTVMPGYFISDAGDMIRTYLSPVSEEESDFSKIEIREDYFQAIMDGYLSEMKDELSGEEKKYFVYAGKFMIYMQAIRFLTDYINNDIYYGAKYTDHNLIRGNNQLELLKQLLAKEYILEAKVTLYLRNESNLAPINTQGEEFQTPLLRRF